MGRLRRFWFVLLVLAALLPAAGALAAGEPQPVVRMSVDVSAGGGGRSIVQGTPLALTLDTSFESVPAGGDFVLQRSVFLFGHGARLNGSRYPSCSAAKLEAARGNPRACPAGSLIGTGRAWGTAIAIPLRSSGSLAVYNGPGGRSLTMHFRVVNPALVDETLSVPIVRMKGRYAFRLSVETPPKLQRILDGDIVVSRILVRTGATLTIGGERVPYVEALGCLRGGSPIHGDFSFRGGATASADATATC